MISDTPTIEALVLRVREADSSLSLMLATRQLAAVAHPESVACLVEVLGFNNPGAAVAAVEGLVAIGPAAVEPLLANLDDHNYGARAWAVRALADIGDLRGLELLENALGHDIGQSVRRAAAKGLGQLDLSAIEAKEAEAIRLRALEALEAGAADGEWVVRYAVVVGLERLGLQGPSGGSLRLRAVAALQKLLEPSKEDTPVVRLRAELALERLTDHGEQK